MFPCELPLHRSRGGFRRIFNSSPTIRQESAILSRDLSVFFTPRLSIIQNIRPCFSSPRRFDESAQDAFWLLSVLGWPFHRNADVNHSQILLLKWLLNYNNGKIVFNDDSPTDGQLVWAADASDLRVHIKSCFSTSSPVVTATCKVRFLEHNWEKLDEEFQNMPRWLGIAAEIT